MAAGFLYQGQCYATLSDATAAHWSENPAAFLPGSTSYIIDIGFSGTAWQIKKYTLASNGTLTLNTTTNLPALTFPTCETSQNFTDGMELGWGVAAALVAAWLVKILRRGL
jgi:hypothetical protein